MVSFGEKAKIKKAGNLNSGRSYVITTAQSFKKNNGYSRSIDDWETRGNYKYTTQVA